MFPTPEFPPSEISCEISVEEVPSAVTADCRLPGLKLQALLEDKAIATCLLVNAGEAARHPEAESYAFC